MSRSGLFIDLDGTLADSHTVLFSVYEKFLINFGKSGSSIEFHKLDGPPLSYIIPYLAKKHQINVQIDILTDIYLKMIENAYNNVSPSKGAINVLEAAKINNMSIGLVTSNRSHIANSWLKKVGLKDYFDVIISQEDVISGKPSPEPYILALNKCKCKSNESLALEDSFLGVSSATKAQIPTMIIGNTKIDITSNILARVTDLTKVVQFIEKKLFLNIQQV